jgi:hypothetical protein
MLFTKTVFLTLLSLGAVAFAAPIDATTGVATSPDPCSGKDARQCETYRADRNKDANRDNRDKDKIHKDDQNINKGEQFFFKRCESKQVC